MGISNLIPKRFSESCFLHLSLPVASFFPELPWQPYMLFANKQDMKDLTEITEARSRPAHLKVMVFLPGIVSLRVGRCGQLNPSTPGILTESNNHFNVSIVFVWIP